MIPELFMSTEPLVEEKTLQFLARLTGCTKCTVTENRNGEYTLAAEFLLSDKSTQLISYQEFISAKPNPTDNNQFFEIYDIKAKDGKTLSVKARHIKHACYNNYITAGESQQGYGTPKEIWDECSDSASLIFECPFSFESDITNKSYMSLGYTKVCTMGDFLGGKEGSLLDVFGGEYKYDNFNISLLNNRGQDTNFCLRFGENISSSEQSVSSDTIYSHIAAYIRVYDVSQDCELELVGQAYEFEPHDSKLNKVLLIESTQDFTVEVNSSTGDGYSFAKKLCDVTATSYFRGRKLEENTTLKTNIKVDFRAELDRMKALSLCDTVRIDLNGSGETATAKIVKAEFDTLLERWNKLELGTLKTKLSDYIKG